MQRLTVSMRTDLPDFALAFERAAMPHLPAAYNLARWLLRHERGADDVVQEAYLHAFRSFAQLRGEEMRPWLLAIVRHACYDWMRRQQLRDGHLEFDELRDSDGLPGFGHDDPLALLERNEQRARVDDAIAALAPAQREVIVLREIEDLPYEDIARIVGIPVGTVMSRLARARATLRRLLQDTPATPSTRTV